MITSKTCYCIEGGERNIYTSNKRQNCSPRLQAGIHRCGRLREVSDSNLTNLGEKSVNSSCSVCYYTKWNGEKKEGTSKIIMSRHGMFNFHASFISKTQH